MSSWPFLTSTTKKEITGEK